MDSADCLKFQCASSRMGVDRVSIPKTRCIPQTHCCSDSGSSKDVFLMFSGSMICDISTSYSGVYQEATLMMMNATLGSEKFYAQVS